MAQQDPPLTITQEVIAQWIITTTQLNIPAARVANPMSNPAFLQIVRDTEARVQADIGAIFAAPPPALLDAIRHQQVPVREVRAPDESFVAGLWARAVRGHTTGSTWYGVVSRRETDEFLDRIRNSLRYGPDGANAPLFAAMATHVGLLRGVLTADDPNLADDPGLSAQERRDRARDRQDRANFAAFMMPRLDNILYHSNALAQDSSVLPRLVEGIVAAAVLVPPFIAARRQSPPDNSWLNLAENEMLLGLMEILTITFSRTGNAALFLQQFFGRGLPWLAPSITFLIPTWGKGEKLTEPHTLSDKLWPLTALVIQASLVLTFRYAVPIGKKIAKTYRNNPVEKGDTRINVPPPAAGERFNEAWFANWYDTFNEQMGVLLKERNEFEQEEISPGRTKGLNDNASKQISFLVESQEELKNTFLFSGINVVGADGAVAPPVLLTPEEKRQKLGYVIFGLLILGMATGFSSPIPLNLVDFICYFVLAATAFVASYRNPSHKPQDTAQEYKAFSAPVLPALAPQLANLIDLSKGEDGAASSNFGIGPYWSNSTAPGNTTATIGNGTMGSGNATSTPTPPPTGHHGGGFAGWTVYLIYMTQFHGETLADLGSAGVLKFLGLFSRRPPPDPLEDGLALGQFPGDRAQIRGVIDQLVETLASTLLSADAGPAPAAPPVVDAVTRGEARALLALTSAEALIDFSTTLGLPPRPLTDGEYRTTKGRVSMFGVAPELGGLLPPDRQEALRAALIRLRRPIEEYEGNQHQPNVDGPAMNIITLARDVSRSTATLDAPTRALLDGYRLAIGPNFVSPSLREEFLRAQLYLDWQIRVQEDRAREAQAAQAAQALLDQQAQAAQALLDRQAQAALDRAARVRRAEEVRRTLNLAPDEMVVGPADEDDRAAQVAPRARQYLATLSLDPSLANYLNLVNERATEYAAEFFPGNWGTSFVDAVMAEARTRVQSSIVQRTAQDIITLADDVAGGRVTLDDTRIQAFHAGIGTIGQHPVSQALQQRFSQARIALQARIARYQLVERAAQDIITLAQNVTGGSVTLDAAAITTFNTDIGTIGADVVSPGLAGQFLQARAALELRIAARYQEVERTAQEIITLAQDVAGGTVILDAAVIATFNAGIGTIGADPVSPVLADQFSQARGALETRIARHQEVERTAQDIITLAEDVANDRVILDDQRIGTYDAAIGTIGEDPISPALADQFSQAKAALEARIARYREAAS